MTITHTLTAFAVPVVIAIMLIVWHSWPRKRKQGKVVPFDDSEKFYHD